MRNSQQDSDSTYSVQHHEANLSYGNETLPTVPVEEKFNSHQILHCPHHYDFNSSPKNLIHKCTVVPIKESETSRLSITSVRLVPQDFE